MHDTLYTKNNLFLPKHGIKMCNHKTKEGMHENPALLSGDITMQVEFATSC